MYNNPYMYQQNYNQQNINERIDNQIAQLQQMKEQMRNQQPAINQTFQLAPTGNVMRYANTIDDVTKENVYSDTPFFSKDMSIVWVKDNKGNIKTYELNEIIPKDNKDLQIESLQMQLAELRKEIKNAKSNNEYVDESNESEESTNVSNVSKLSKKSKWSKRNYKQYDR